MTAAPTLPFDVAETEPTRGRVSRTDGRTARVGASRARVQTQRRMIACRLSTHPYVTADDMWSIGRTGDGEGPERGTWASRLAGLVHDGILEHGELVRGRSQQVVSYVLTEAGRRWRDELLSERRAS